MPVDLTEFHAAVAALDVAIEEIGKRQRDRREAFVMGGKMAEHVDYYELRGKAQVPLQDRDNWMAENYPKEHAQAQRAEAEAKTFVDEQAKRQDALKPLLEKALTIVGREFGSNFVAEAAGSTPTLDDVEDAFIRINDALKTGFKFRQQVPKTISDYEGPCSLAFYRELAPAFGVDPSSRDVINRVRQEMVPGLRLHG